MKKLFFILGVSLTIVACGGHKGTSDSGDSTGAANKSAVAAESNASNDTAASHNGTESTPGAAGSKGAELIKGNDCGTCHKEQDKLVGPAFVDVAKKYENTDANVETLVKKIITGGSGNWGTTPMTPHPSLSEDDAKDMVKYILSLKK